MRERKVRVREKFWASIEGGGAGRRGFWGEGGVEERGAWEDTRGRRAPRMRVGRRELRMLKKRGGRRHDEELEPGLALALLPDCPAFQPVAGRGSLGCGFSFCAFSPGGQL